ncbi:MAG TPA: DUF523 domain-containing protein [Mariprofundaceae bacterium]|nr:DUF523 domain-containing protein [Mariprofundaceae bacterium]
MMQRILVSACLLGQKVRYDGGDCRQDGLLAGWQSEGRLLPFCPEVAGGLAVPRPAAEIDGGNAEAVLFGRATIHTREGTDVTDAFLEGAEKALAVCRQHGIRMAILKEGSPSCGSARVGDGSFSGVKVAGQGLTARLLERHGIRVFSEERLDEAAAYLHWIEVA